MAEAYTVEKLLLDETFRSYCLEPSAANSEKWLNLVAVNQIPEPVIEEAKLLLDLFSPKLSAEEIEQEVIHIRNMLPPEPWNQSGKKEVNIFSSDSISSPRSGRKLRMMPVALAGLILIAALFWLQQRQEAVSEKKITKIESGLGERKKFLLPDGTEVIMNSSGTITIDEQYNHGARIVEFTGNAFFDVVPNASLPFIVRSGNFSTKVLGTSFYINADSVDNYGVKLLSGKVTVEGDRGTGPTALKSGEQLSWTDNRYFLKSPCDTGSLSEWVRGKVVFANTPVTKAFRVLEQWYRVPIVDRRKAGSVPVLNGVYDNQPLNDVLKVICFTLHSTFSYDHNRIIIQ